MSEPDLDRRELPPLMLPPAVRQELAAQAAKPHADRRDERLTALLFARDSLVALLDQALGAQAAMLDIALLGDPGDNLLISTLGRADLLINGKRIGVCPAPDGVSAVQIPDLALQADNAPAAWVVIAYGAGSSAPIFAPAGAPRADFSVRVAGWLRGDDVVANTPPGAGLVRVALATLRTPDTLLAFLLPEPGSGVARVSNEPGAGSAMISHDAVLPVLHPAALLADQLLATATIEVDTGAAMAWPVISAPGDWDLPQAPAPDMAALFATVIALLRRSDFAGATELLDSHGAPELLDLRAAVYSLWGNLRGGVATARAAYKQAPEQALRLFGPVGQPQFALAWQHPPTAALAANAVAVIDTLQPEHEVVAEYDEAALRLVDEQVIFSLALKVPAQYAGLAYRIFVLGDELRRRLDLESARTLRQAFAYHQPEAAGELEHVLLVQTTVLTTANNLLGGVVPADGFIDIWEPVQSIGRAPDSFFIGKTVVVALYPGTAASE